MENEIENVNSPNDIENENSTNEDTFDQELEASVDVAELQKKNQSLYEQLRKAQGFKRVNGQWVKEEKKPEPKPETKVEPKPEQGLSTKDAMALIKANVEEEDIDEVESYAKFKNISIAEALKTTVVKTLLSEKAEQRKTAQVTNTQTARRSTPKTTPEDIRDKALKGDLPESEDDIKALYEARRQEKLNKNKR